MSGSPNMHGWTHRPASQGGTDPVPSGDVMYVVKLGRNTLLVIEGDDRESFAIPSEMDGWFLVNAQAFVATPSSSGNLIIQVHNETAAADMLSTRIRIDASEETSYTAATPSVIGATNGVSTGDKIRIDVDDAGTGSRGLGVNLTFSPVDV